MHLTCTNMPVEKLDDALDTVKTNGIQNILALRGDPPHGQDTFVTVEGGFSCALDLVGTSKLNMGTTLGSLLLGTQVCDPLLALCLSFLVLKEAHPEVITSESGAIEEAYKKDLAYLKEKVDAGGEVIITQLFYDTDVFLKFVSDCHEIGIKCPIVPGIMPIQSYKGILCITGLCKTKVPAEIKATLEPIEDNEEAV
ncbi:unnamed protein product [Sphagnum troendelagicum]|uniref:Methylenetetrahydrofolate reductase (NAD(P)H) n=1 Tax=Sphagnum jensenii TaxID=128206 RepID=A0ABP0VLH8_9BRYO